MKIYPNKKCPHCRKSYINQSSLHKHAISCANDAHRLYFSHIVSKVVTVLLKSQCPFCNIYIVANVKCREKQPQIEMRFNAMKLDSQSNNDESEDDSDGEFEL